MEVENEGRDLLTKTEQVDGSVQQRRFEFLFQIDRATAVGLFESANDVWSVNETGERRAGDHKRIGDSCHV